MEPRREVQSYQNNAAVSVGDWIVTFILLAIPIVNLILLFVWGFSDSTPLSKKNYAKATLIIIAVVTLLMILSWASLLSMLRHL